MTRYYYLSGVLSLSLGLTACSGPTGPNRPVEPPPPPESVHPDYETFDSSPYYVAAPPTRPVAVEHDVPDRLLEGRVDLPEEEEETIRTVEGFRIQIFSGEDRNVAEAILSEARAWWESQRGAPGLPANLEPDVAYIQPYYRVRLGAFETRASAEPTLARVRQRYQDAFLVPDLVTIRD